MLKRKKQISFIVLFLFLFQLFVVHPKKIFASDFNSDFLFRSNFGGIQNESFTAVTNTQDGNFIAVGYSSSVDGDLEGISKIGYNDAIIVKYDNQGNIIWKKAFGGSDNDSFQGVAELSDGNIIAVGYSFSTNMDLEGLRKGYYWGADAVVVKYDKNGNIIWKKSFGGSYHEQFNSIKATKDGGFIAVGSSNSTDYDLSNLNKGYTDAVIVKYNSSGEVEWIKTFGGIGDDAFYNITQTADNGFVAVGSSSSTNGDLEGLKNEGSFDAVIVKYDVNGNIIWKNTFGGQSSDSFDGTTEVSDGGYVAVGHSYSNDRDMLELNNGDSDGTIVKYDINGNVVWKKTFGGSNSDYLKSITTNLNNDIIVSGFSSSYDGDLAGLYRGSYEAVIFKMDSNGNIISKNSFGGTKNDNFYSVLATTNGNYVAVGYSASNDMHMTNKNKGYQDAIIIGMKDSFLKTVNVEGIALERNSKILKVGDSFKLKYTITPNEATNKTVIWESSDPTVATIDSLGYVKALRAGNATITVRTLDGNFTDSCEIVVGSLTPIYNQTFGGKYYEKFNSVFYSNNGEIVAVGHNNSSGTLGDAKGGTDAVIIILDENKNVIFTHNFGGSNIDEYFNAIKTTTGDYVAVGYSWSNDLDMYGLNKGFPDAIIVKYDSNGNILWKKSFGGSGSDYFYSIAEASDGGYIVVGLTESNDFDINGLIKGSSDVIIVKYSKDGKLLWKKVFGGSGSDILYSVTRDAYGNFVAAGYTNSYNKDLANVKSNLSEDGLIIKFDENGEIIWIKVFGGYGGDYFKAIKNTSDGNIIAVGYSYSNDLDMEGLNKGSEDAIIVKFDSQGNVIWKNNFGGSYRDIFSSVAESSDGGFVAVGSSWSIDKDMQDLYFNANKNWYPPSYDAIIVKFDANGNIVWKYGYGGSYEDEFNSISITNNDEYVVAGYSPSTDGNLKGLNLGYGDAVLVIFKEGNLSPINVSGVKLNTNNKTIIVGDSFYLVANIIPTNATNKSLIWTSSNPNVAVVDENGKVTGVSVGTTTITVTTSDGGFTDSCEVIVNPVISVTGISLDVTNKTLKVGESFIINPIVTPENASNKAVSWESSNSAVASVDWQGRVIAKAVGNATITARTADGGYTASCEVIVEPINVTGISLNVNSKTLKVGDKFSLTASVQPVNATEKRVIWSSSNESVATVNDSGLITAVGVGKATITATTIDGNFTASCEITVESNDGQPISLTITNHFTAVNKTVDVLININNVPSNGILAADFILSYDKNRLQVINIAPGEVVKDTRDFDYQIDNNQIIFLFADESINDSRIIKENGTFAKITFKVLDTNVVGKIPIEIIKVGNFVSPSLTKYNYSTINGYIDTFKYGDVNGDGKVASDDYVMVKNYILKRINQFNYVHGFIAADVSLDNEITSLDYIAIKKYILNKISNLPLE